LLLKARRCEGLRWPRSDRRRQPTAAGRRQRLPGAGRDDDPQRQFSGRRV